MPYRRRAAVVLITISLLLSIIAYYESNELLRLFFSRSLQRKDAFQSSGAYISLGGASVVISEGCWNLELSQLHIGNAPYRFQRNDANEDDDWSSPYAVHLNSLRVSVSGPMALLSLLQLPIASTVLFGSSASIPRIFFNGLDFVVGFRVRSVDCLEIDGLTVFYIEEGDNSEDHRQRPIPSHSQAVIKSGLLWLIRGNKRHRHFDFVLEANQLSWFESKPGLAPEEEQQQLVLTADDVLNSNPPKNQQQPTTNTKRNKKSRGSIKLFPSTSVKILDDQLFGLELISDIHCLVLRADSIEERDAWVDALIGSITKLRYNHGGGGRGNAPWLEVLVAEANARKVRWRRKEKRQRHEWRQKWQPNGDGQIILKDNANDEDDDDDDMENEEDVSDTAGGEGGDSKNFLTGIRNALDFEGRRSNTKTKRFEDALEWRIGRLEIQQLALHINDRTHLHLDKNGWVLRGFVGSSNELRRRLRFDLGPKLLTDSTGHAIKTGITGYTGKEEYVFGDLTKTAVRKVGTGIADSVEEFTGKEQYEFGDLTKTAVKKIGIGIADSVEEFTGKEQYEFGDLTKTAVKKVGTGIADSVEEFTGKEQYEFGDLTKAVFSKLTRRKEGQKRLGGQHMEEL